MTEPVVLECSWLVDKRALTIAKIAKALDIPRELLLPSNGLCKPLSSGQQLVSLFGLHYEEQG
jgi:hypothetical protein